jgi:hypothetical protein
VDLRFPPPASDPDGSNYPNLVIPNGSVAKWICGSLHQHPIQTKATTLTFVIPTGAYPDFLLRCRRQGRVCGFP